MKYVIERPHRLDKENYVGFVRTTFTLCVKDKKVVFVKDDLVKKFARILKNSCRKHQVKNWIYIFMPEHVHLILEGTCDESDLWKCVVLFKQKTGYWFSKEGKSIKWQKDFYDHIHRKHEDLIRHIRYLAENPVQRKITDNWEKYPYVGSLDYQLGELL